MASPVHSIKELVDHAESYTKTTFELYKLKLLDKVSTILTSLVSHLAVVIAFTLFVIVLSIGVALWLGALLGKSYYGFFAVAGFYLIAAIVLHFFLRKWLRNPVANMIIKEALQ